MGLFGKSKELTASQRNNIRVASEFLDACGIEKGARFRYINEKTGWVNKSALQELSKASKIDLGYLS